MDKHGIPSAPVTEASLSGAVPYKAAVVSYFDGMFASHRQLLSYGARFCGDDSLLAILCYADPRPSLSPGKDTMILTVTERWQYLDALHHVHILPWPIIQEPGGSVPAEGQLWPLDPNKLLTKINRLIPGHELWDNVEMAGLLEQWDREEDPGFVVIDRSFKKVLCPARQPVIQMLSEGSVDLFREETGYAYPLSGRVVAGRQVGRQIGFPTANIQLPDQRKLIPRFGAYAAMAFIGGKWYQGMVNIGIRPTISKEAMHIEAHLFGFDDMIYGEWLTIALIGHLREEKRFASLEELTKQLRIDSQEAKKMLAAHAPFTTKGPFVL